MSRKPRAVHTEKARELLAGVLECAPTAPQVVDNIFTAAIAKALAEEGARALQRYARRSRSTRDAARRVRDILGVPSTAADIAYAVACGDEDVAAQMAERLQQERLD